MTQPTTPWDDWLIAVGRKLRTLEGDHMVASTKLVKRLRSLSTMHAIGVTPRSAAYAVSRECAYSGDGGYEK